MIFYMGWGLFEKIFSKKEIAKREEPKGTQVINRDASQSTFMPAVGYGERTVNSLDDTFSIFEKTMLSSEGNVQSFVSVSLHELIYGQFNLVDVESLERIRDKYVKTYNDFKSFLNSEERRALITLETIANARIDYVRRHRGKKDYDSFVDFLSMMMGTNSTSLKYKVGEEDPDFALFVGNADEKDESIADKDKALGYGTIHKKFLKDIIEGDRMAVIDTWTEENYDLYGWRISKNAPAD